MNFRELKDCLKFYLNKKRREDWFNRINIALQSDDNQKINKVKDAGKIINGNIVMHNGVLINSESYYGYGPRLLLEKNEGVHEPQEEYVFQEVLKFIEPNSIMLELGSYWSFYSIWFQKSIKGAVNYMIEPEKENLTFGKQNFSLNNCSGSFTRAFIGSQSIKGNPPTVCVDDFVETNKINHLSILHSDIQGFELDMLKGAKNSLGNNKIDYLFISTHSNDIHNDCLEFIREHNFITLAEANLDESFSLDGLIVARRKNLKGLNEIKISKRKN